MSGRRLGSSRPRGRPRSEAARENILRATLDLLAERGYAPLTVEGIAAEAGVSKQTIYRWWHNKGAVILDALLHGAGAEVCRAPADEGSLDAELLEFTRRTCAVLRGVAGKMMRGMMAEAQQDEQFARIFRSELVVQRRRALKSVFERAKERGMVICDLDVDACIDLVLGALWYRLLSRHLPLDDEFAAHLAGILLRALHSR